MMLKLIEKTQSNNLYEIFQTQGNQYAFASKTKTTVTMLHPWVKCRDFLNDIVWSNHYKKYISQYGMSFNGANTPLSKRFTYLLIKFESETQQQNFEKNIHIIHDVEKTNKLPLTTITPTDTENVILLTAHSFWQTTTISISVYSYLCRICMYPIPENTSWTTYIQTLKQTNTEQMYYLKVKTNLLFLLNNIYSIYKQSSKPCDETEDHYIHNYTGFVSTLSNYGNREFYSKFIEYKQKVEQNEELVQA